MLVSVSGLTREATGSSLEGSVCLLMVLPGVCFLWWVKVKLPFVLTSWAILVTQRPLLAFPPARAHLFHFVFSLLDYLLSNNYVNSIIVHKFDFSDEEIMAYYISFLKTLSLKLNNHTVHFFYNEHTNDFALYTEAIKFFNHPESMVRIAVRTITLNVYKGKFPCYLGLRWQAKCWLPSSRARFPSYWRACLTWAMAACLTKACRHSTVPCGNLCDVCARIAPCCCPC